MTDDIRKMTKLELHLWLYENRRTHLYTRTKSPVHGVGINDADYSVYYRASDGKHINCPCYQTWSDMIGRCYSERMQTNNRTYIGTKLHPDWFYFSNFREWWVNNYIEGGAIDKDILYHPQKHGPNKIYGPDNCIYIPHWLNSFASTQPSSMYGRGIGRHRNGGNYSVRANDPTTKKLIKTYSIKTAEEAYVIYIKTKLSIIRSMRDELDNIHPDLYMGLIRHVMSLPRFSK